MKTSLLVLPAFWLFACAPSVEEKGFRDLNKNGQLDVYEDSSAPLSDRVENLLAQMTLAEKAGMLFINGAGIHSSGSLDKPDGEGMTAMMPSVVDIVRSKKMTHFNLWAIPSVEALARWNNHLQRYMADSTRLGIPVTIATDPRNAFSNSIFSMSAQGFSQWPEQLGLAAIGDPDLVWQHADMARQEYLALGLRVALHPVADLATEPRWPRIVGTFGEDAQLSKKLTEAYVRGFQGDTLGSASVACMTKHFSGGGPQKEGLDSHFEFHKGQVYPGDNFAYHQIPFGGAFAANTAAIMPYYGVPVGQTSEEVAFGFNKDIITGLLREQYGFEGVICTDWGLITDANMGVTVWPARAWGVEHLSEADRVLKALDAGVDQFGGESRPELVIQLVEEQKLSEERIDQSVRRLLKQKFQLGLFDDPFVDEVEALQVVGQEEFSQAGEAAQRRAFTLLKNDEDLLPLSIGTLKLYLQGVDSTVAASFGTIVGTPDEADLAIVRIETPWYPVETKNPFALSFHHGDLDFKGQAKADLLNLMGKVPAVVDLYLDRPAVIPEINSTAKALLVNFGASDQALLDVLFGVARPEGRLPIEMPSSMEAVKQQKEDLPYDSENPLYPFGAGLSYKDSPSEY